MQSTVWRGAIVETHFCQWCVAPSPYDLQDSDTALLYIDKYTIEQRFAQSTKAVADEPSTRQLNAASLLFEYFCNLE